MRLAQAHSGDGMKRFKKAGIVQAIFCHGDEGDCFLKK
jgi:hypothetical protein